jgi:DNA-binding response OmpR family regulator
VNVGPVVEFFLSKRQDMKILIVDDSTINNILLESILSEKGYEIYSTLNGNTALEKIEDIQPDLVLLDIMMPEVNGFDVLRKMRTNNIDIPVIIISAYDSDKFKKLSRSLGASAYILKPINGEVLVKNIEKVTVMK